MKPSPRPAAPRFPGAAVLALPVILQGAEESSKVLGLPAWIWQLVNLSLFLAVLVYFVARPLTAAFRKRQLDVEERLREARRRREEAGRLEADIRGRMARVETEIAEIRARGVTEGEAEKRALVARADEEAERVLRDAQAEIERRLAYAREELKRTAADLIAAAARDQVIRAITDEDRRRLIEESVERLGEAR